LDHSVNAKSKTLNSVQILDLQRPIPSLVSVERSTFTLKINSDASETDREYELHAVRKLVGVPISQFGGLYEKVFG
jgi:hypothetical protein